MLKGQIVLALLLKNNIPIFIPTKNAFSFIRNKPMRHLMSRPCNKKFSDFLPDSTNKLLGTIETQFYKSTLKLKLPPKNMSLWKSRERGRQPKLWLLSPDPLSLVGFPSFLSPCLCLFLGQKTLIST